MKILKQNEDNENETLKNLATIKTLDSDMTRFIMLFRDYFKWMLLLNITSDVINLIVDFYWIYAGLTFGNNPNFARTLFGL